MAWEIKEGIMKDVEILMNYSDKEILALSLQSNPDAKDNYQMVMGIKLKGVLRSLDKSIWALKKSMTISSWVMGIMTFLILVLTGVLVWRGVI